MKNCSIRSLLLIPIVGIMSVVAVTPAVAKPKSKEYTIDIIAEGLSSPTGIASYRPGVLVYSEIPMPGVGGEESTNAVRFLNTRSGATSLISMGEPEPVNIAVSRRGDIYWTCKTAGVILEYNRRKGVEFFLPADPSVGPFLESPSGITVSPRGEVLFTEVPTPGELGDDGGMNMVSVTDGEAITLISDFEPEPTDIVIASNGSAYWTCKSAGVILQRSPAGVITLLLENLDAPTGIALDRSGRNLFFTEVPNPGVPNGGNKVSRYDLRKKELSLISGFYPQPTDVTVSRNGDVYWTCTFAGVIARASSQGRW